MGKKRSSCRHIRVNGEFDISLDSTVGFCEYIVLLKCLKVMQIGVWSHTFICTQAQSCSHRSGDLTDLRAKNEALPCPFN